MIVVVVVVVIVVVVESYCFFIDNYCWARWTTSGGSRASLATTSATEVLISRQREYVPICVVALALHWLVIQRTRPLIKVTFRGFSRC